MQSSEGGRDWPGDLVLTTRSPSPRRGLVELGIAASLLAVCGWVVRPWQGGEAGQVAVAVVGVVGMAGLVVLGAGIENLVEWLRWRRRGLPALRLTEDGIDYSPAFDGTFPLHVDWGMPMACAIRPGVEGVGTFWCLFAPVVHGTGPLGAFLGGGEIPGPDRAWSEAKRLHRAVEARGEDGGDIVVLRHLLAWGTPIAINLQLADGPLQQVDQRLHEWSSGQVRLVTATR